jgi:hypothetical protein
MEDFNHFWKEAQDQLARLETLLADKTAAEEQVLKPGQALLKRATMGLESCEMELKALEGTPYYDDGSKRLAQLQDKAFRLQTDLQFKTDGLAKKQALMGRAREEAPASLHQMSQQQVIGEGDRLAQAGRRALDEAYGRSEHAKEVASGVELELHQQDEQLDRVRDKTEDLRSKLKAANKVMTQIYRRFLTDRIIICLIVCIGIIIVFLLIYGAAGMGGNSFNTGRDAIHT